MHLTRRSTGRAQTTRAPVSSTLERMEPGQEAPKLRELYAYCGYALFLSQTLEGLLEQGIFALVILPANTDEIKRIVQADALEQWDEFVDRNHAPLTRMTIGRLIKKLQSGGVLSQEAQSVLVDALNKRNFIVHNIFKEWLPKLYTEKGQDEVILFLRKSLPVMQKALDSLGPVVEKEMERYGYDKEYIYEHARKKVEEAKNAL